MSAAAGNETDERLSTLSEREYWAERDREMAELLRQRSRAYPGGPFVLRF